jgi:hypothetical protein
MTYRKPISLPNNARATISNGDPVTLTLDRATRHAWLYSVIALNFSVGTDSTADTTSSETYYHPGRGYKLISLGDEFTTVYADRVNSDTGIVVLEETDLPEGAIPGEYRTNVLSTDVPTDYAGQSSIVTVGTISTGVWSGTAIGPAKGGTGVANNAASTLAISGSYATTFTITGITGVTLPESGTLATRAGTETLTNKRITPRVVSAASSATPTPNADTTDLFVLTALGAAAEFAAPTGTPTDGQVLRVRIKDDSTARALTYNAIYRASSDLALPSTTVDDATLYMEFTYNAADTKWDLTKVLNNF